MIARLCFNSACAPANPNSLFVCQRTSSPAHSYQHWDPCRKCFGVMANDMTDGMAGGISEHEDAIDCVLQLLYQVDCSIMSPPCA